MRMTFAGQTRFRRADCARKGPLERVGNATTPPFTGNLLMNITTFERAVVFDITKILFAVAFPFRPKPSR
jgi:hypothetical protein